MQFCGPSSLIAEMRPAEMCHFEFCYFVIHVRLLNGSFFKSQIKNLFDFIVLFLL